MFFEKYKDIFDDAGQGAPFQKQMQDLRGIASNLNRKNNIFAKNANSIINGGSSMAGPAINTSMKVDFEKPAVYSVPNRNVSYPRPQETFKPAYNNSTSAGSNSLRDKLTTFGNNNLNGDDDRIRMRNKQANVGISGALRDAFSWNNEDNAAQFRSLKVQRKAPEVYHYDEMSHVRRKHELIDDLQRSPVEIPEVLWAY